MVGESNNSNAILEENINMSTLHDIHMSDEMKQQVSELDVRLPLDPDNLEVITLQDGLDRKLPTIQCSWSKETCC